MMRTMSGWLWFAVLSMAAAACVANGPDSLGLEYFGETSGSGDSASAGAGTGGSPTTGGTGLPCEVADLLDTHCNACHASGTTPPALDSYASLTAPSSSDPSRTVAEVSLDTMLGTGSPMPPTGLLSAAEIAPFESWIGAGMPSGACGGGGTGGAGADPLGCTTGMYWTEGDNGSHKMYPGRPCIDCHVSKNEGPAYLVAGTVYPSVHEPDDCFGTPADLLGASVEIVDANNQSTSLPIKAAGNFSLKEGIAFPITVKVVYNGKALPMLAPVQAEDGDCNTCHSPNGSDGAPGRILIP